MPQIIWTASRPCGSGKTYHATNFACELIPAGVNHVIPQPTIDLTDQSLDDAKDRYPALQDRIHAIYGNGSAKRIVNHLKRENRQDGELLFITHAGFTHVSRWVFPEKYNLIVDETINVANHVEIPLYRNRAMLDGLFNVRPCHHNDRYSVLEPVSHDALEDLQRILNRRMDKPAEVLSELVGMLLSDHWTVHVLTEQWQKFKSGEGWVFEAHGLLHPSIFEHFQSVTLMGANLEDSIMVQYFEKLGVEFQPHPELAKRITHTAHDDGHRLTIKRFSPTEWSKSLRDNTIIEFEGQQMSLGDVFLILARREIKRFPAHHITWMANADIKDRTLRGWRLSNVPHGMNDYQDAECCVVLSSLRPKPSHNRFLQEMTGMSDRQIRRALLSSAVYQAMSRGNMRKRDCYDPFLVLVPDQDSADDVQEWYPGAKMETLLSDESFPRRAKAGRPSTHKSAAHRAKAAKNRITWKRAQADGIETLISTTGDSTIPNSGFAVSLWEKQDTKQVEVQRSNLSTDELVQYLRFAMTEDYAEKAQVPLICPAVFDFSRDPGKGHTNSNVALRQGLIMDIDGTPHTPQRIHELFAGLRLIVASSFNHSPQEWRYRLFIPTTTAIPPDLAEAILTHLSGILGGKEMGVDTGKFYASAMFRLPSKRPDGFLMDFAGEPVVPMDWIKRLSPEIIDKVSGNYEVLDAIEETPMEGYSDWSIAGFEKAKDKWREACLAPKTGHAEFHRFGWRLHGYRMALPDIEMTLREHAYHNRHPDQRLKEIPDIIGSIRKGV